MLGMNKLIVLALAAFVALTNVAQAKPVNIQTEKINSDFAAILVTKLADYVQWPESKTIGDIKTVSLCIMGDDPAFLNTINRTQTGWTRNVSPNDNLPVKFNTRIVDSANVHGCDIAYIPESNTQYEDIIDNAKKAPVLTVSSIPGFASEDGVFELVLDKSSNPKGNFIYKINLRVAEACGLLISSSILHTAQEVIR